MRGWDFLTAATVLMFECQAQTLTVLLDVIYLWSNVLQRPPRLGWRVANVPSLFPAGLRILVNLLLDTLPMLGNVLLLCFFVFFIFGIIGVQLWAGLLRNRCYLEENFTL